MIFENILSFFAIVAILASSRVNYLTVKSKDNSLTFWQQRFNVVASDYQALQKDHDAMAQLISQMREDNGKLAVDVFNCNFTNRGRND